MQRAFEDLASYDVTDLKTTCPAFKNSCPFTNIADSDLKEALKKCPEFTDGCPFKDVKNLQEIYEKLSQIPDPQSPSKRLLEILNAIHDVCEPLEQALGDCPVFHQTDRCPFKTVRSEGVSLVDPPESVVYEKRILKDLIKVEVSNVKGKCPAFKNGCPFAKIADEELKAAIEKCPEFNEGCPFKEIQNMADLFDFLSKIPDPQSPAKLLVKTFQGIHTVSRNQRSALGDCSVFYNVEGKVSCPFKNVRSNGKHLVEPVTDIVLAMNSANISDF